MHGRGHTKCRYLIHISCGEADRYIFSRADIAVETTFYWVLFLFCLFWGNSGGSWREENGGDKCTFVVCVFTMLVIARHTLPSISLPLDNILVPANRPTNLPFLPLSCFLFTVLFIYFLAVVLSMWMDGNERMNENGVDSAVDFFLYGRKIYDDNDGYLPIHNECTFFMSSQLCRVVSACSFDVLPTRPAQLVLAPSLLCLAALLPAAGITATFITH